MTQMTRIIGKQNYPRNPCHPRQKIQSHEN